MKDGDKIKLPGGYYLELCSTREEGLQGFVASPCGNFSASLAAARGTGVVSNDRWEDKPIPPAVMEELESEDYDQFE